MHGTLSYASPEQPSVDLLALYEVKTGTCDHEQRLVAAQKELLTLLGKVEFRRPYDQCLIEPQGHLSLARAAEAEQVCCTHGEAPADALRSLQTRRTSGGASPGELSVCQTHLGGSSRNVDAPGAADDVSSPSPQSDAPGERGKRTSSAMHVARSTRQPSSTCGNGF